MLKFFCLILVLTSFVFAQTSVTPAGTGTRANPYQIDSLPNLYWLSQTSSAWDDTLVQTSDIDASKTSGWASNSGFSPIGNMSIPFTGSYNGQGHIISGLTIHRSETLAVGFFGYVSGGKIDSLGLSGAAVTGGMAVGIVVGYLDQGTLSNSYATGSVSGSDVVGGLAGYFQGTIAQSFSLADVSGTMVIGGLVGYGISGTLSTSYFAGTLDGSSAVNGLIASNYNAGVSVHASFWDSTGAGLAIASDPYARSTALMQTQTMFSDSGWNFTSTWSINAASNQGYPYLRGVSSPKVTTWRVTNIFKNSASVAAYTSWSSVLSRGFCWNMTGNPTLADSKLASTTALTTSAFSANVSGLTEGITYFLRAYAISASDTIYGNTVRFTTPSLEGAGTSENPYLISSYDDLKKVGVGTHSLSATYRLTSDIDASGSKTQNGGAGFYPIGSESEPFKGVFQGAGFSIKNLNMNWQGNTYVGLFGYSTYATIDSLGLVDMTVKGYEYLGSLAGMCYNCRITAVSVSGLSMARTVDNNTNLFIGGLLGRGAQDTIVGTSVKGSLSISGNGLSFIGGLIGNLSGSSLEDCFTEVTITAAQTGLYDYYVGGLLGKGEDGTSIEGCHTNSSLNTTSGLYVYSGGLAGITESVTIVNSYAEGSVTAYVNNSSAYSSYAGGLVGHATKTSIDNSYAGNSVSAYNSVASKNNLSMFSGGLVGYHKEGHIFNSYSTGSLNASALTVGSGSSVNANLNMGGLVGYGLNDSLGKSYSVNAFASSITASGTGSSYRGAIIGYENSSVVADCYWNSSRSTVTSACGSGSCSASSLDSASMLLSSSFPKLDYDSTWIQYNGHTFPLIRSLMTPLTVTANDILCSYDGVAFTGGNGARYSTTYTSSLISGTLEYDGTSQGAIDTGTYSIEVSGLYSTQLGYAIDFEPGSLHIDPKKLSLVGLSVEDKTYDGTTDATFSGQASLDLDGILTGEFVSLSLTSAVAKFSDKNVGSDKEVLVTGYSLSGEDASNYVIDSASFTADITAYPITVTARDTSKVYGASDPVFTYSATALLGKDTWSGALSRESGTQVGTYDILIGTLNAGDNYKVTFNGAVFSILKSSSILTPALAENSSVRFVPEGLMVQGLRGCLDVFKLNGTRVATLNVTTDGIYRFSRIPGTYMLRSARGNWKVVQK